MVFILGGEGGGKSRGCLVLLLLQPTNQPTGGSSRYSGARLQRRRSDAL